MIAPVQELPADGAAASWLLPALLLAVVGSAFFSGIETGLYRVNRMRLELRSADPGDARALRLAGLLRHPDWLLCVFLIGNNIANAAAAALGEAWMGAYFEGATAAVLAAAVLTPVLFLTSEALPKQLFHQHAEDWTYRYAGVLRLFSWLLAPLAVVVLPTARLTMRWASGHKRRGIKELRRRNQDLMRLMTAGGDTLSQPLRETALEIEERQAFPVARIMIPIADVALLPAAGKVEDLRRMLDRRPHRRYPLREADGTIRDYVFYLDPYLEGEVEAPLSRHARPLIEFRSDEPLVTALARLEAADGRLGIVRGPDGRPVGLVAIRDLAEGLLSLDARL